MSEKKIIKYSTVAFVIVIFSLAVFPKLYAEENFVNSKLNIQEAIDYKLDIPCAIDKTQIILPVDFDPNYAGEYKVKCNSFAYFDEKTNSYHLKLEEGYYLDLTLVTGGLSKVTALSDIEDITLMFYTRNNDTPCYKKELSKSITEENKYQGKLSKIKESTPGYIEDMKNLSESCGVNTNINFNADIKLRNGKEIKGNNIGDIKYLIIDTDGKIIEANIKNLNPQTENAKNLVKVDKKEINTERISKEKISSNLKSISSQIKIQDADFFITEKNFTKKIIPVNEVFKENKINTEKIVSEVVLEIKEEKPLYVFEVKEKRKILGFIPFGEKIVIKEIPAIREIKE